MILQGEGLATSLLVVTFCMYGITAQDDVADFLTRYDQQIEVLTNKYKEASWMKDTNITDENEAVMVKLSLELSQMAQQFARKASYYVHYRTELGLTADKTRQLKKIQNIGTAAQTDETKLTRLKKIISEMVSIYSTAKVCDKDDKNCMKLEPELTELMRSSRDCGRLSAAWQGWRDAAGSRMKNLYTEYVELSNDAIRYLGYKDLGDYWKSVYDTATFEADLEALIKQLEPLYKHLHTFVRRRLKDVYGDSSFPSTGHIPAHLLGNMWAQNWMNIWEIATPYKGKQSIDVTSEMLKQGYTVERMFRTSESFFYSLGFDNMTDVFWKKSMFVRPDDREVVCHAGAWDMVKKDDFRIKMCTVVSHEDLMIIHHEMGHIQYFMQYKDQPSVYRAGANPGFHEAVGDTIYLSAQTPEHLHAIGLLKNIDSNDKGAVINFLMKMALEKVAFLPFGYLIDQWRWSVFRGDTPPSKYNTDWWKLRCRLQGISPPVARSPEDFDPGSKFHIPSSVPYIRYFVSFVIQFQFYKAACDAAGYTGPLHRCDIYNNADAGKKIRDMLQLGASKPWPDAMEKITGQRKMDAGPLLEYFKPLMEFLENENKGEQIGWQEKCPEVIPLCHNGHERLLSNLFIVVISLLVVFSYVRLK